MAGKTKKRGSPSPNNASPRSARGGVDSSLKGHLGLKSSAFAPTDCKLVSQYLVVDHMSAHYKKLHTAKSAIDNTPPKAWLTSQKMRDRARRKAIMNDLKRREAWLESSPRAPMSAELSRASSECDRDEMLAMMESHYNADYDEVDGSPPVKSQIPDGDDMKLIDEMVNDSHKGPSAYHSPRKIASNIPSQSGKYGKVTKHRAESAPGQYRTSRQIEATYNNLNTTTKQPNSARNPRTPREGGDLLETHSHKFNEEKPFQPRTLKGKNTAKSKLSEFKYYNPPKRGNKDKEEARPTTSKSIRSVVSRPETPMTFNTENSMELMNETLMSRDMSHPSPGFVPPLDISLDADNAKWLKEQSRKAHARKSGRTVSGVGDGSGLRGTRTMRDTKRNGLGGTQRVSGFGRTTSVEENREVPMTSRYPSSLTMYKVETAEEDLKYLEFENDVTRDILDRGICTNRVLKQVFEAHLEARKKDLKVSRMREILEDLRRKLGVPPEEDDDFDGVGLKSTVPYNLDEPTNPHAMTNGSYDVSSDMENLSMADARDVKAAQRRMNNTDLNVNSTMNPMLTTQNFKNLMRDGRPPLPRPGSRGKTRRGSGNSSIASMTVREESFEKIDSAVEEEVFDRDLNMNPSAHSDVAQPQTFSPETEAFSDQKKEDMLGTIKPEKMSETKADILTIHQIDEDAEIQSDDGLDDTLRGDADGGEPVTTIVEDEIQEKEEQHTARTSSYEPETDRTDHQDYDADFEEVYTKQLDDKNQSDEEVTYREDENEDDHDDDDEEDDDDEPPSLQACPEPPKVSPPKPSPRKRTSVTSTSSSKNPFSDSEEWTGGDTSRSKIESLGTTRDTEMDSESIVVSELTQGDDDDNDEF